MLNKEKTTQELMNELTDKLIIPLKDNEILCPTCKGLRMVYKQINDKEGYIETCRDCYNGKLYVCKHCGKQNKTDFCNCEESYKERNNESYKRQHEKELKLFEKAKKIKFADYDGHFIIDDDEHIKTSDDIEEWIYDMIKYEKLEDEDLPQYLWATKPEPVFTLNLYDIIYDKTEDGYEDMYSNLNTDDDDLEKAQEYLDKWYKKQGDSVNVYYEDNNIAVLLDDLIKEIKEDIKNESEE
jgi:hypothetical protein